MQVDLHRFGALSMMALVLASATGCDSLVDRSRASASVTQKAFSDATSVWTDVFTYHPPAPPAKPQTRYCYHMSSDIVCYDSVQPGLTAKLYGYQDGDQQSWIQPGGGSLGASGGNPVAYQPVRDERASQTMLIKSKTPMASTPVSETGRSGEIQTMDLSPR
jgi:hypothetical protein